MLFDVCSLSEATRKQILERYVARYINHVTTQKDASGVGGGSLGNSSNTALHPSGRYLFDAQDFLDN